MTLLRPALFVACALALVFLAWENYDLWWKVPGKEVPEDKNPMSSVVERIPCPEGMGMSSAGCLQVSRPINDEMECAGDTCRPRVIRNGDWVCIGGWCEKVPWWVKEDEP